MYWLTQSLLSSWKHFLDADDAYADAALSSFLSTLRREEKETTQAMQAGIDFEAAINSTVAGVPIEPVSEKYDRAIAKFSRICSGGQPQCRSQGRLRIGLGFPVIRRLRLCKNWCDLRYQRVQRYEYGEVSAQPAASDVSASAVRRVKIYIPDLRRREHLRGDVPARRFRSYRRYDFMLYQLAFGKWIYQRLFYTLGNEH